jgi:hypothetical protein
MVNASDPRDASVHQLLHRLVCVLVDHPDDVAIRAEPGPEGATFLISTHLEDVGKVIGSQGRTAGSLRTIISGIGRKLGRRFTIVIQESDWQPTPLELGSRENLPA